MTLTTTRMGLPYPAPDRSDPFDVAEDIGALAQRVDSTAAMADQGTLATRPAAGIARRIYYATDAGVAYYDTGTAWIVLSPAGGGFVGELRDFAIPAASLPTGWLPCDGNVVSRATYAALYAALGAAGSPWGQGDGATTFNLPDIRGRVRLHAGQGGGLTNRVLGIPGGAAGGAETVTLTEAQIPAHSHTIGRSTVAYNGNGGVALASGSGVISTTDQSTGQTGGGGSHTNMQPFAVVLTAIKAL